MVSAIPDRLVRFACDDHAVVDPLAQTAGDVDDALSRLASAPSDVPISLADISSQISGVRRQVGEFDEWVESVGRAFERAGEGAGFVPSMLSLLFGRPLLVGAQPHWSDDQVAAQLEALLGLDPNRDPDAIAQPLVSPLAVREFVNSLSDEQLAALVRNHPELVGPVDGMPIELRYEANRTLITNALDQARADGDTPLVATLESLAANLDDRQFLFFDPAGDGRAAEVFGNLAEADNVTVFVPGITNRLDNFGGTRGNAQRIHEKIDQIGGNGATIAWLGYDTPELLDAPLEGRAQDSAVLLQQLWNGLNLDLGDDVVTTNVGHSYGSLVTAYAFRDGFEGVDNLIVAGSPGLGVDTVEDLDLADGVTFHAMRAPGDFVSWSENFGRDPSDPRFGAIRLETGTQPDGSHVTGHSAYTDEGTLSVLNIASIAAGYGPVDVHDPGWFESGVGFVDSFHETVVEGPIDFLQDIGERTRDVTNGSVDWIQDHVPLGPLNPLIDGGQNVVDIGSEYGGRLIDTVQRLTSPDAYGDLIGDLLALDVPERLARWANDRLDDAQDWAGDRLDDVEDWTGDRIDDVEDWTGDRIDDLQEFGGDARDFAEDRIDDVAEFGGDVKEGAEDLWDNTFGRL